MTERPSLVALTELMHGAVSDTTMGLISRRAGLGESLEELHVATINALLKEVATLGIFVHKRMGLTSLEDYAAGMGNHLKQEIHHAARGLYPLKHDGIEKDKASAPFLSAKAVCERTSLSRATLLRLAAAGQFPQPLKMIGRLFYDAAAIEEWVQQKIAGSR